MRLPLNTDGPDIDTSDPLSFESKTGFLRLIKALPGPNLNAAKAVKARQDTLTKPKGALGRLEEITEWLALWQGGKASAIDHPQCLIFAGNHGVTAQGVSAYPAEVTAQMIANFQSGGAAINQLCNLSGIDLDVVPITLNRPTGDISQTDAMSEEECLNAIKIGFNAVNDKTDILLLGEMGIGNTTVASALCLASFGGNAVDWTGSGTGVTDTAFRHKTRVVETAVLTHKDHIPTSFDLLQKLGGRELAAIVGAVVKARLTNIPVVLDGFISVSAAASLLKSNPKALDHCMISHLSAEAGHQRLCEHLNIKPILDLDMRLGEASGAATAFLIIRAALATFNGMATFEGAGVTNKIQSDIDGE
jgi:nicotinate-nucleotide--dimethylbenzimidazole phosphoribosyltransferase